MKKILVSILLVMFIISCATLKPYDSETVKMSMQTIMGTAKAIGGALESKDLSSVPMDFMTLEQEFRMLSKMEAPKGSTDDWAMIHIQMADLSMEGKKAAEDGDGAKVGKILGKLFELQKKGHMNFKQ